MYVDGPPQTKRNDKKEAEAEKEQKAGAMALAKAIGARKGPSLRQALKESVEVDRLIKGEEPTKEKTSVWEAMASWTDGRGGGRGAATERMDLATGLGEGATEAAAAALAEGRERGKVAPALTLPWTAIWITGVIALDPPLRGQPATAPALADDAIFLFEHAPRCDRRPDRRAHPVAVVGMDTAEEFRQRRAHRRDVRGHAVQRREARVGRHPIGDDIPVPAPDAGGIGLAAGRRRGGGRKGHDQVQDLQVVGDRG